MTYLTVADMREDTAAEFARDCFLTSTDVGDDALVTAAITRFSQRFDDWTLDHFSTQTAQVLYYDGEGLSRLYLPRRCTAITTVEIAATDGTLTSQSSSVYRLHSSLDSTGSTRIDEWDFLDVVPLSGGLTGTPYGFVYQWPWGVNSVKITGTFGWTVTPGDVKRAVALLVWDHFKPLRGDLKQAQSWQTADIAIQRAVTDDAHPSGIPEVDQIVASYKRDTRLLVA